MRTPTEAIRAQSDTLLGHMPATVNELMQATGMARGVVQNRLDLLHSERRAYNLARAGGAVTRRALALMALLAACGPAPAPKTEVHDGQPPARFRGDVVATQVTFTSDVGKACAAAGLKAIVDTQTVACEVIGPGRREIIARNPCKGGDRDLCHAIGHLNGWPKDHGS